MSNRSMPSLAALLGLVAIAGYQNREKIGEFIRNLQNASGAGSMPGMPPQPQGLPRAEAGAGGGVPGGLGDLIDQFRNAGLGRKADSWVATGQNEPVNEKEMAQALGPDLVDMIARQTGLDRAELLKRLSQILPQAVDHMTPGGRLPPRSTWGGA